MKLYNEIYNEIQNTIKTLGIASGIVGRTYISSAVMLAIRQPWRIQAVTKYLYTAAINRYINNLSVDINFEAADVNEDGEINGDDSLMLMDYLVGNITHF